MCELLCSERDISVENFVVAHNYCFPAPPLDHQPPFHPLHWIVTVAAFILLLFFSRLFLLITWAICVTKIPHNSIAGMYFFLVFVFVAFAYRTFASSLSPESFALKAFRNARCGRGRPLSGSGNRLRPVFHLPKNDNSKNKNKKTQVITSRAGNRLGTSLVYFNVFAHMYIQLDYTTRSLRNAPVLRSHYPFRWSFQFE